MEVKKRVQNGHFGSHFDPLSGGVHRGFPVVFLGYLAPKGVPKWGNMGGQGVSQNGGPFWTPIKVTLYKFWEAFLKAFCYLLEGCKKVHFVLDILQKSNI